MDNYVEAYLVGGTLPPQNTTCDIENPNPFLDETANTPELKEL
jgi:hypothetical protein